MRFTVGNKIGLGFLTVVFALLALVLGEALADRAQVRHMLLLHDRGVEGSQLIGQANTMLHRERGLVYQYIATRNPNEAEQLLSLMRQVEADYETAMRQYKQRLPLADARRQRIDHALMLFRQFVDVRDQRVLPAVVEGRSFEALVLQNEVNSPRFQEIVDTMLELEAAHVAESRAVYENARRASSEANRLSLVIGLLAALAAAAIAAILTRDIARRLRDVSGAASRIARGDLDVRVVPRGNDEITDVAEWVNRVTDALGERLAQEQRFAKLQEAEKARIAAAVERYGAFVSQIARGDLTARIERVDGAELERLADDLESMAHGLRSMTLRVNEAVAALTAATAEIGTTVQQHATSANETASAVAETAATVDEVQQSAERVTEHARRVAEVSARSVEVTSTGREAVDSTVHAMNDVHREVDGIAQRILSLSEQSQAVGQIIATVNEIAERAKLLALNAAIEASRAGEAGAGFVVVAQEIRALADQSKEATAHVRSILGDIQRSTTEAVLATEEGAKAVERAVDAVRGAGDRLEQLADSIGDSTAAAEHILAAAQQQAQGVDQISKAMHAIDAASRQTVNGTRIIEKAARDLHELASALREAVSQYRT